MECFSTSILLHSSEVHIEDGRNPHAAARHPAFHIESKQFDGNSFI